GMTFENWQMAHFRILGNDKYHPYGTSVLEPARRIWRQLTLMEDAMMAYRIVRAPARKAFYVDVGNIPPQDVEQYMQRVITAMKRNQVVNQDTGRVDLRYNPTSIEEDYYIPVRGGTKFASIENIGGQERNHDIDDVKYLRDKLFSAIKIPASYLTQGEGDTEDKTTLAMKDVRFARTVQRLQRPLLSELEKIGIVHLHTLGFRGEDLISFTLALNNPSKIAEIQELEHWNQKFSVATNATDGFFSKRWVAENLFGMSEEEFIRNKREIYHDRKYEAELNAVGEAAGQQASGALAGGLDTGMPTGFEGAEGLPGAEEPPVPEAAPEAALEPAAETPAPAGGEAEGSPLLATPGKRDEDGRKTRGPRTKSIKRTAVPEAVSGGTLRGTLPGYAGHDSISTLQKGITSEATSYEREQNLQEERIFSINYETERLLENLKTMETKIDEAQ
ncbi:MAG: portal protein, partial [Pseudomonadota bacterium]|nr:portal protein [Pseudomonadota bacterium]